MHFLGTSKLTGVATLDMILDLFLHSWPEVLEGNLLFYCPEAFPFPVIPGIDPIKPTLNKDQPVINQLNSSHVRDFSLSLEGCLAEAI